MGGPYRASAHSSASSRLPGRPFRRRPTGRRPPQGGDGTRLMAQQIDDKFIIEYGRTHDHQTKTEKLPLDDEL